MIDEPILVVNCGLHRSARMPLPIGSMDVGSDAGNAAVLSDATARTAFHLRFDGRSIVLVAADCDAVIDGRRLRRGREHRFKRPSSFVSGGLAFSLEWTQDPASTRFPARRHSPRAFAAGVASTLALAGLAGLVSAPSLVPARPRAFEAPRGATGSIAVERQPAPTPAKAASLTTPQPDPGIDALIGDMRRKLAVSGLDGVAIDMQPDGGITAAGRIVPAKGDAWQAVVRWFDTAAAGRAVLVDRVQTAAAAAALQVQAVYTGRTSYVIDGEGQKLFVGASLPDGWVIQKIESRGVLVRKGDQVVVVRF